MFSAIIRILYITMYIHTTYTVSSHANNDRITMEKDTDTRTDSIRDWDYCIHSPFFYRIDGILRDRGR